MSRSLPLISALLFMASLSTSAGPADDRLLLGTLYVQSAAEWRGLCRQAFQAAAAQLEKNLADERALAALEQAADPAAPGKPPAIIVDIDETVLDNSAYQARLVLDGKSYADPTWDAWVNEKAAPPIPGSLDFLNRAAARGVAIFYVSNRKAHFEEATRANLDFFGFPLGQDRDYVLLRDEREDWGKDKASRRRFIAEDFRIIMLVGDDLGDFISSARSSLATRRDMVAELGGRFGDQWFLLPNPGYGSWLDAIKGFRRDLPKDEEDKLLLRQLDPRRN